MNLQKLKRLFSDNGCEKIYVKSLSANDNSKNQVYLGGNFEVLNILPISAITTEEAGDWNRERFKAEIDFSWITDEGEVCFAPRAQLILYPKYPEVRFSGFLAGCKNAPSELMTQRLPERLLFLGVTKQAVDEGRGAVFGYVSSPESESAKEFNALEIEEEVGLFKVFSSSHTGSNRSALLEELYRIHKLDWIISKRLGKNGNIIPCRASNCGGYTLEAELGITPNGFSEPDFLGWEIKQFGVRSFDRLNSHVITLMTPEPTDGIYRSEGVEYFLTNYGYPDKRGREDRINFGGIHRVGERHTNTKLEMKLIGFDTDSNKIRNSNGRIALIDEQDNEAASWSFSSMLLHWNRKHNRACYIPSLCQITPERKYKFGDKVLLGIGADFQIFLKQMADGHIYYDPGIKMENVSTNPKIKQRSQFRIKSQFLDKLYTNSEVVILTDVEE